MAATATQTIGNRLAPARFILFALPLVLGSMAGLFAWGWKVGIMAGFDLAAIVFLLSCMPLLRVDRAHSMADEARRNDATRAPLLVIPALVTVAVFGTIPAELTGGDKIPAGTKAL